MSFRRLGLLLALPTVVGISLSACGTEDDAAPGPAGGSGAIAGAGGHGATAGGGGALDSEAGDGGGEPGPGAGGEGGDSAGGAGGDSAAGAGGDSAGGADGEGGEGGQAPVACRTDLFKFDTDPGTGSMKTYLTPATGPVQSSTVSWSADVGAPTPGSGPGSGKLIATFGALGEQAQLSVYPPAGPLACQTKLHAMVKLISAGDLSTLNGISLSINSGPFDATGRYSSQFTSTASWVTDTWYAIELPFATAGYQNPPNTLPLFEDVRGFGVQLQTKTTGAIPVEVTMYVDDIWVE